MLRLPPKSVVMPFEYCLSVCNVAIVIESIGLKDIKNVLS